MSYKANAQEIWWERYLPKAVFYRLDECRTTKDDIPTLLDARWRYAQDTGEGTTKEECLEEVVELLECNGLVDVTELTQEEMENYVKSEWVEICSNGVIIWED